MARTVVETRIQDRTARTRLAVRNRPYWRLLSEGAHLGYRSGARKGSWIARYRTADGRYLTAALGEADDHRDANGGTILSFKQAFDEALKWIELVERGGTAPSDPDMTIAAAVAGYIAMRDARRSSQAGRTLRSDASYKLTTHVLEDQRLAPVRLGDLTERDLKNWQLRLSRRKPASIQRIVNDFKAALNAAYEINRAVLPTQLPVIIKYGLKVDTHETLIALARDNQIMTDDEVRRIVAAAVALDADFGRLVVLLAATGARFSQVARMTVGDVQPAQGRLLIPQSYKGRKRVLQYIRVQVGSDTLAALAPALAGRPPTAPLLERWRHRQVGPMRWEREARGPWQAPSEMARLWKQAVMDAALPVATIPYGLRHSSIVRGLRAGLPIRLVAALHDTSVAMIERHYSRWITEGLDELVARAVIPIVAIAA